VWSAEAHLAVGLLQRHAVLGMDIEELLGDGGEPQTLLHDGRHDVEARRDLLLAEALVTQGLEGTELVQRGKRPVFDVSRGGGDAAMLLIS